MTFHGLRQKVLPKETPTAWGVYPMSQQTLPRVMQVHRKSNTCTTKTSANPHAHDFLHHPALLQLICPDPNSPAFI